MSDDYEIFDLELESLSPIHIGSGDVYSQLDYVSKNNKVFILDFDKILENLARESIDDLTYDILRNFDNNRWAGNVEKFFEKYGIHWKKFVEREYDLVGEIGKNEIKRFICSGRGAYIPGSSLKGAIKTAVFFSILKNNKKIRENIIKNLKWDWNDKEIKNLVSPNSFKDLFRAFQISDSQTIENIKIAVSRVYHFEKKRFDTSIVYQIADKFNTNITCKIDRKLIETNQLKKENFNLTKENIFKACNDFSKEIIKYELEKLDKVDDRKLSKINEFYRKLEEKTKNLGQNECLLRVGQGSSSIATTMFLALKEDGEIREKFIREISRIKRRRYNKSEEIVEFFPLTSKFILESNQIAARPLGWAKLKSIN